MKKIMVGLLLLIATNAYADSFFVKGDSSLTVEKLKNGTYRYTIMATGEKACACELSGISNSPKQADISIPDPDLSCGFSVKIIGNKAEVEFDKTCQEVASCDERSNYLEMGTYKKKNIKK